MTDPLASVFPNATRLARIADKVRALSGEEGVEKAPLHDGAFAPGNASISRTREAPMGSSSAESVCRIETACGYCGDERTFPEDSRAWTHGWWCPCGHHNNDRPRRLTCLGSADEAEQGGL